MYEWEPLFRRHSALYTHYLIVPLFLADFQEQGGGTASSFSTQEVKGVPGLAHGLSRSSTVGMALVELQ